MSHPTESYVQLCRRPHRHAMTRLISGANVTSQTSNLCSKPLPAGDPTSRPLSCKAVKTHCLTVYVMDSTSICTAAQARRPLVSLLLLHIRSLLSERRPGAAELLAHRDGQR